jgi:hypothetical protein
MRTQRVRRIALVLTLALTSMVMGCSSTSTSQTRGAPNWVHDPTRSVDSGYIVYIGTGEDYSPERANFKAEASAIQDVANECSFAPKGARIEDRYDYFYGGKHQAYAKIGISFEDCEQAKQTLDPTKIQAVANVAMTQELKQFQEMEYAPATEVAENPNAPNPALANTTIQDDGQFFVMRQQVAYAKEIVIISPPGMYAPGTPQNQVYFTQVVQPSNQISQYEQVHPQVRTWHNSWSGYERSPQARLPSTFPRRRNYGGAGYSSFPARGGAQQRGSYDRNNGQNGGQNSYGNGRGRGRRRKNPEENQ